jgi:hypothetical protein
MNQPASHSDEGPASREEMMSALFAHMVMQQSNMAMMLLGKVAHPQTGQTVRDLEAAQLFIDQIEMLEAKTKGNLTKEEERMLKQTLMALRMAFVEAAESGGAESKSAGEQAASSAEKPAEAPLESAPASEAPAGEEEHRKKFSKKY